MGPATEKHTYWTTLALTFETRRNLYLNQVSPYTVSTFSVYPPLTTMTRLLLRLTKRQPGDRLGPAAVGEEGGIKALCHRKERARKRPAPEVTKKQ